MINRERFKKESLVKRLSDTVSNAFQFSGQEVLYILFMAALLTFFSTFNLIATDSSQPYVGTSHYGFPFESLTKIFTFRNSTIVSHGTITPSITIFTDVEIVWFGLAMDLIVYTLLSALIIKMFAKVIEEISYHRYDRK